MQKYTEVITLKVTKQQKETLNKLKNYNVMASEISLN